MGGGLFFFFFFFCSLLLLFFPFLPPPLLRRKFSIRLGKDTGPVSPDLAIVSALWLAPSSPYAVIPHLLPKWRAISHPSEST
ncbi:hypothetical protein F4814DRAFT_411847 [Daldinia grandis]|nr:hypothetical protein F4814DRAFT_411847 [Daldinia grandis]